MIGTAKVSKEYELVFFFDEDILNAPDHPKQENDQKLLESNAHQYESSIDCDHRRVSQLYTQPEITESSYKHKLQRQSQKQCWELAERSLFHHPRTKTTRQTSESNKNRPTHNQQSITDPQSTGFTSHLRSLCLEVPLEIDEAVKVDSQESLGIRGGSIVISRELLNNHNQIVPVAQGHQIDHLLNTMTSKQMNPSSPQSVMQCRFHPIRVKQ